MSILKKITTSFWLRSMMFSMLLRFSLIIFSFGTFAILAHYIFDNTEMGYWGMFIMIISTIELTKQGLLRNALIKFMHNKEFADNKHSVQSSAVIISFIFTIIITIALLVGAHSLAVFTKSPPLEKLLYWSIPYFFFLIPFNHFEIVLQGNFEYKHNFYAYVIRQGIFFLFIVLAVLFFKSLITLHNLFFVQIIALLISGFYLYSKTKPFLFAKFQYNKEILLKLLQFGKYVFGTALFGNLSRSADHFITANMLNGINNNAVSYYNVVSRVTNMIDSPTTAAADILFPKNAQAGELEGLPKVKYYFEKMVGNLTALIIPSSILIVLLPKFVLLVTGGSKYVEAVPILQLMGLFAIFRPFIYNFGHTIDAIGKPRINFWINAFIMTLNFVMTYFFIKMFGLMGAAYASAVMSICYVLIFYFILKKYLNLEVKNIFAFTLQAYQQIFGMIMKKVKR